tara:strand:- start:65 stop:439 length:375 start_codon:yes stop_codon:yes gene_type:complete
METLQSNGLWHLSLARQDLIDQGGLKENDLEWMFNHITYKDRKIVISHIANQELVVSMEGKEDEDFTSLITGFSKVVGYDPFCKYTLNLESTSTLTYEWDKIDPDSRYTELSTRENVTELSRLN